MTPQTINLEGWSNTPLPTDPLLLVSSGAAVDLTGATARMQVRTAAGAVVIDISGPSANGVEFSDEAGGKVVIHIGWTDMRAAWIAAAPKAGAAASLTYDLLITDASGLLQARAEGTFTINAGVTLPNEAELANPPFAEGSGDFKALIPTTATPVVAHRTASNTIIARVLTDTGIIEEFSVKDPDGFAGVDGGYQRVVHRAFVGARVFTWLVQPEDGSARTTEEAAIRIHDDAYAYVSGGDSTGGNFGGFGHGYWENTPNNNQVTMTGGPAGNLQSFDAWAAGTTISGSELVLRCEFRQVFFGTATEAVSIIITHIIRTDGMSTDLTMQSLRSDVNWQDSYAPMFAATASNDVTHAKLAGETAIALVGDGAQKGNWSSVTALPVMQFYSDDAPTIICQCEMLYGPPARKNEVSLNWSLNNFGRVHVSDVGASGGNAGYGKFRVFINSSEQTLPRSSWDMDPADIYTSLAVRRTVIRAGGAI